MVTALMSGFLAGASISGVDIQTKPTGYLVGQEEVATHRPDDYRLNASASGKDITIEAARDSIPGHSRSGAASSRKAAAATGPVTVEQVRLSELCKGVTLDVANDPSCRNVTRCPDGQTFEEPKDRMLLKLDRTTGQATTVRDWELKTKGRCVALPPGQPPVVLDPTDVFNALLRHGLPTPQFHTQPAEHAIVNLAHILIAQPNHQHLTLDVGGVPVEIQVATTTYTWNPGDGAAAFTTLDPGQPYPNHTVTHTYTKRSEAVTITLTAHWTGTYRIAGTTAPFQPIIGTATTSSYLPLPILEAQAILVAPNHPTP